MIVAALLMCSCSAAPGRAKTSFATRWKCPEDEIAVTKVTESFYHVGLELTGRSTHIDTLYSVSGCDNQGEYWVSTDERERGDWLHTLDIPHVRDFTREMLEDASRKGHCPAATIKSRRSCPSGVEHLLHTVLILDCNGQDRSFACATATQQRMGGSFCEAVSNDRLECL